MWPRNDDYVVYGGEFTEVNGTGQQGLVRFARTDIAPNDDGPRLGGNATGLTVRSYGVRRCGSAGPRTTTGTTSGISYRLYRDTTLIHETDRRFALLPPAEPVLPRPRLTAGQTYTYKVERLDPFGNTHVEHRCHGTAGRRRRH